MFSFITKPIGCLFSLVGAIVLLGAGLLLGGMWLLSAAMPQLAEKAITKATGFPTEVGNSSLSYLSTQLTLEDVRINNPEHYPERDFLILRSFVIGLDRKASTRDSLVFDEVTLNIDTLTLVRGSGIAVNITEMLMTLLNAIIGSEEGQPAGHQSLANRNNTAYAAQQSHLDGNGLTVRFDPPPAMPAPAAVSSENGQPAPRWLIRSLTLRINNARLFESTVQGNLLRLVPLNYEQRFTNVTSLKSVIPSLLNDLARRGLPISN